MIKSFKKIKNLGLFSAYQWDSSLPDLERYNLIYGWNGSGKTTLSKLFSALEKGELTEFKDLEYEVDSESGTYRNGQPFTRKVRVFNRDYIDNNIELVNSKTKAIFILGEENKVIAKQIKDDETLLEQLQKTKKSKGTLKSKRELEKGRKFTDIARIIGANTSGTSVRNYRKNNAEDAFNKLPKKELLNEIEQNTQITVLKQEEKEKINEIVIPKFKGNDLIESLKRQYDMGKEVLLQTVKSAVIERLKDNIDISEWAETGLLIHRKHESKQCEFCNQDLPDARIEELTNYFNEEDQKLKKYLDDLKKELREIYSAFQSIYPPDKANLYKELQKEFQSGVDSFEKEMGTLLDNIGSLGKALSNKKSKTTEKVDLEVKVNTEALSGNISEINSYVVKHNNKTKFFENEKKKAQDLLEKHYLSEIFDEIKAFEQEIVSLNSEIDFLNDGNPKNQNELGINALNERIKINKAKISSSHKGCEAINEKLNTFLGRSEIAFEVVKEGYIIKRNGKIANNLCEGEKTAIAFVHFIIHLRDQDFNIDEGIIVIDDPVSSLDSNSLFQAFAFLKNSVKKAKQVFILTHNFDLLRLLLNWLTNTRNSVGKKTYLMIKNKFAVGEEREAFITRLDPELINHESEYHYLFKKLLEFETDGTIASVYHIPTIARKVLETFLMFRVPDGQSAFKKLETLAFDEDKKTAIYKFTNDQSHITGKGFDPSLVPETQNNVQYLLEMMKTVFPEHYDILENSIKNPSS